MLDQVSVPGAVRPCIGQQAADNVELMVSRKDLVAFDPAGLAVLAVDDLGVVFDDVREALRP